MDTHKADTRGAHLEPRGHTTDTWRTQDGHMAAKREPHSKLQFRPRNHALKRLETTALRVAHTTGSRRLTRMVFRRGGCETAAVIGFEERQPNMNGATVYARKCIFEQTNHKVNLVQGVHHGAFAPWHAHCGPGQGNSLIKTPR